MRTEFLIVQPRFALTNAPPQRLVRVQTARPAKLRLHVVRVRREPIVDIGPVFSTAGTVNSKARNIVAGYF
jgi:hypothetical protein